jgi:hypothetical protein
MARAGRLMTASFEGKEPRPLFTARGLFSFRYARLLSPLCVIGERGWSQISFSELDGERGRGKALRQVSINTPLDQTHWDLSPDGSRIAILVQRPQGPVAYALSIYTRAPFEM